MKQKWIMGLALVLVGTMGLPTNAAWPIDSGSVGVTDGEIYKFTFEYVNETIVESDTNGNTTSTTADYGVSVANGITPKQGEELTMTIIDSTLTQDGSRWEIVVDFAISETNVEGNYQPSQTGLVSVIDWEDVQTYMIDQSQSYGSDYNLDYLEFIETDGVWGYNYSYDLDFNPLDWHYNQSTIHLFEKATGVLLYSSDNQTRLAITDETTNTTRIREHQYHRTGFSYPDSIDDYPLPVDTPSTSITTTTDSEPTDEETTTTCTTCDTSTPDTQDPDPSDTSDSPFTGPLLSFAVILPLLQIRRRR